MFAKSLLVSVSATLALVACGQAPKAADASSPDSFRPPLTKQLSGDVADGFLDALTGAGAYDASGALGAENVSVESVTCSAAVVPHPVPHCTVVESGQEMTAGQADAATLFRTLVQAGAVVNNHTVGATNAVAYDVRCSRVVYPGAHATCTFQVKGSQLAGQ